VRPKKVAKMSPEYAGGMRLGRIAETEGRTNGNPTQFCSSTEKVQLNHLRVIKIHSTIEARGKRGTLEAKSRKRNFKKKERCIGRSRDDGATRRQGLSLCSILFNS